MRKNTQTFRGQQSIQYAQPNTFDEAWVIALQETSTEQASPERFKEGLGLPGAINPGLNHVREERLQDPSWGPSRAIGAAIGGF